MAKVVKRRGKDEPFDESKVYNSVYQACRECDLTESESETIANDITDEVKEFVEQKQSVNTSEIFGFVLQRLAKEHEAVAFMFQTHRETQV